MTYKGKLKVLIVGCGNIAGYFDERRENINFPYTHAGAYDQDGRFDLMACVEPNDVRKKEFMAYWEINYGFSIIDDVLESEFYFDVISICSPTVMHWHDLQVAIQLKPKVIFCEKPITYSIQETEQIIADCKKYHILLAVNYTRAWDSSLNQLKDAIERGEWGALRTVVATYNKGILNNGSHILDLLYFFLESIEVIGVTQPIFDFF
jgi:predicted dehydrogenase